MPPSPDRDYVLGTHDAEIERLGLQHRVWRPIVLDAWQRAGIASGARVVDIGAGPGWATVDLAEVVGPTGEVVALERSRRFLDVARTACAARHLGHVRLHEIDLMAEAWPASGFDAAWCRWVACFVASPPALLARIAAALRPGGVAVFHEYADYVTWRHLPRRPRHEEFVQHVMASWRSVGGEPNIGADLPALLADAGFVVREAIPRIYCARPGEPMWQWPAAFIEINLDRLRELGRVDADWATSVREEFAAAVAAPEARMMTPMVLEIVAERIGSEA